MATSETSSSTGSEAADSRFFVDPNTPIDEAQRRLDELYPLSYNPDRKDYDDAMRAYVSRVATPDQVKHIAAVATLIDIVNLPHDHPR